MADQLSGDAALRQDLALEALCQLDSMIGMLRRELQSDADPDAFEFTLRSALVRAKQLTSVMLSVHQDDSGRETEEMHRVVHGRRLETTST
jgi:hypothetical protein